MLLVSITLIIIVLGGVDSYQDNQTSMETDRLVKIIEKYAVQCYATEGAYPPNVDYLEAHYGLILNRDKYIYEYEAVAENIRPIVQVFLKPKGQ